MANEFYGRPGSGTTYSTDPAFGVLAKIYSPNYIKALYARPKAFMKLRNFSAEVKSMGSSVMIPVFPRLTAQNVSLSDGSLTGEDTDITQQEMVINYSKGVDYKVPMNVMLQTQLPDLAAALADNSARAIVDSIDHAIVSDIIPTILTAESAVAAANYAGTLGSDMTEDIVYAALGKLVDNYVDLSNTDDFVWILPSSQYGPIHKLKGYTSYRILPGDTTEGGQDVKPQQLTLMGIDVHFRNDSEMSVTGGKLGGLFYRDAVAVAIQREPSLFPPVRVPNTILWDYLTWALFGLKLIKPQYAVQIQTK